MDEKWRGGVDAAVIMVKSNYGTQEAVGRIRGEQPDVFLLDSDSIWYLYQLLVDISCISSVPESYICADFWCEDMMKQILTLGKANFLLDSAKEASEAR